MLDLETRGMLNANPRDHARNTALWKLLRRRQALEAVGPQHQLVEEPDGAAYVGDGNALVRPVDPAQVLLRQQHRVEAVNAVGEIEVEPGVGVGHERGCNERA